MICRPKNPTLAGQLRRSAWLVPAVPAPWGPPPRTHGPAGQAQEQGHGNRPKRRPRGVEKGQPFPSMAPDIPSYGRRPPLPSDLGRPAASPVAPPVTTRHRHRSSATTVQTGGSAAPRSSAPVPAPRPQKEGYCQPRSENGNPETPKSPPLSFNGGYGDFFDFRFSVMTNSQWGQAPPMMGPKLQKFN